MTKIIQMAANEDEGANRRRLHLREISGDADAPLETVGQDLRAARIRRGDDLAAVSRALKIRKDHLEALESDRLEDLPGRTYALGFVRSYARYLGLDTETLVERFKAEISGRTDDAPLALASIHQDDSRRLPHGWRIVAGVVIVALLWGGWHIFFSGRDPGQSVPPAPKLTQSEPAKPVAAAPAQEESASAAPAPQAPVAQAPAAQPPAPPPAPQIVTAPLPAAEPQAAVPAVPGTVFGQQNSNVRVVLHARGTARVTVRGADGKTYLNKDMMAGQSYRVPDIEGLVLATSNAGALDIDLDGAALGKVGQPQQVLGRVSLDPQSLADRIGH